MNGAKTEPCATIIISPTTTRLITKGISQYFFLALRKSQISLSKSIESLIIVVRMVFSYF